MPIFRTWTETASLKGSRHADGKDPKETPMPTVAPVLTTIFQKNKNNCSGFARALNDQFQVDMGTGNADAIIDHIAASDNWVKVGTGKSAVADAVQYAGQGYLVV